MNKYAGMAHFCAGAIFFLLPGGEEAAAQWIDEALLDESTKGDVGGEYRAVDPNEAALFQLSRIAGIGRAGAGRIGLYRCEQGIAGFDELQQLAGSIEEEAEHRFRFGRPAVRFEVKQRFEWKDRKRGDLGEISVGRGAWSVRTLFERDRGERRWDDFRSWSLCREGRGLRRIIAGDLSIRLGSGLLVGTVAPFGPPVSSSISLKSRLVPYRSKAESNGHFGIGAEQESSAGRLFFLLTSTGRDARVDDHDLVSSIDPSGYHRTDSEESRRDALRERIAAIRWEGDGRFGGIGLTAAAAAYDPPLGGGDLRRKPTAFRGDRLQCVGVDLLRTGRAVDLGGEMAWSSAGGVAIRGGAALRRGKSSLSLRFRTFSSRFHAPRGTVYYRFGSEPVGETGMMALVTLRGLIVPGKLMGRMHYFRSHGRTWLSEEPVRGIDWYVRHEGRSGSLSPWIALRGEKRLETRRGERVVGEKVSMGSGLRYGQARGPRIRLEGKIAANRDPGGEATRVGSGVSSLIRYRNWGVSWTRLFRTGSSIIFPVPALPGSIPLAWFGRGRPSGGVHGSLRFALPGRGAGVVAASRNRLALEIAWGTG